VWDNGGGKIRREHFPTCLHESGPPATWGIMHHGFRANLTVRSKLARKATTQEHRCNVPPRVSFLPPKFYTCTQRIWTQPSSSTRRTRFVTANRRARRQRQTGAPAASVKPVPADACRGRVRGKGARTLARRGALAPKSRICVCVISP